MVLISQRHDCVTDELNFHIYNSYYYDDNDHEVPYYEVLSGDRRTFGTFSSYEKAVQVIENIAQAAAKGNNMFIVPEDE